MFKEKNVQGLESQEELCFIDPRYLASELKVFLQHAISMEHYWGTGLSGSNTKALGVCSCPSAAFYRGKGEKPGSRGVQALDRTYTGRLRLGPVKDLDSSLLVPLKGP